MSNHTQAFIKLDKTFCNWRNKVPPGSTKLNSQLNKLWGIDVGQQSRENTLGHPPPKKKTNLKWRTPVFQRQQTKALNPSKIHETRVKIILPHIGNTKWSTELLKSFVFMLPGNLSFTCLFWRPRDALTPASHTPFTITHCCRDWNRFFLLLSAVTDFN